MLAVSSSLSSSQIAIATATSRTQCVPKDETFVASMLALFVNKHGFEQHRLLLLTDRAVHRVKFDFGSMRVVHSNPMPLSALLAISKGYLRTNDGHSRFGFQLSLRLDAAAAAIEKTDVQPFVFLSVADESQPSTGPAAAHAMGRRSRSHTTNLTDSFVWLDSDRSGRERSSAGEITIDDLVPSAANSRKLDDHAGNDDDDDGDGAAGSIKYQFAPASESDRLHSSTRVQTALQPSPTPRTLEDCDVCERQVEKFVRAISALAPATSVVSDALRLAAEKRVIQQQSSLVTRLYNKLNFGRRNRGNTEGAIFVDKPLATQVRALVNEAAGDEQWLNHQLSYVESIFNAPCAYVRKGGTQQGTFYVTQRELMFCVDNTNLAASDPTLPKSSRSVWQLTSITNVSIRLLSSNAALGAAAPDAAADPLALVLTLNQGDSEAWLVFEFQTMPLAQEAIELARDRARLSAAPAVRVPPAALAAAAAAAAVPPAAARNKLTKPTDDTDDDDNDDDNDDDDDDNNSELGASTPTASGLLSAPLPALPMGEHLLLDTARQRRLVKHLPHSLRYAQWQLFYKLSHDGASLTTMLKSQPGGPQLLLIEDNKRRRFGVFMSNELPRAPTNSFVGLGSCFLVDAAMRVYTWTHRNEFFMVSTLDFVAFGSGDDGHYGLLIDRSLECGSTARCDTFGNPALTVDGSVSGAAYASHAEVEFQINDIEIWSFFL